MTFVNYLISLLSFSLVDLSIVENEVLKSTTLRVWDLMSNLICSTVSFTYMGALALEA